MRQVLQRVAVITKLYPHIKTEENKGLILYKVENAAFEPSVTLCDSLSLFF